MALGWAGMAAAEPANTERIVAIGSSVAEILVELGLGDRIVGTDSSSVHSVDGFAGRPNVGYMRQLSAEGILSLKPTAVIAIESSGPPDALKLLGGAGVLVASVPDKPSSAGVREKIESVARLVGQEAAGAALAERAAARFAALAEARGRAGAPVRALFVLSQQNGRTMVGGRETTADGMLKLAGATNVAAAVEGYKPMSDEAVAAAAPDVVVTLAQGPGGPPSPAFLEGPGLRLTPAARAGRLVVMDGPYLLGFGPRTPEAARELMVRLYPGVRID